MINIWCDFLERNFIKEQLPKLIKEGKVKGATSNPSIFANAFKSESYKEEKASLKGLSPKDIYESLAIKDIQLACDAFRGLYEAKQSEGLVSIEIDPTLSEDAEASINEGLKLFELINRPNVMIKVPATKAGYKVMQALMSEGVHVNATLVFGKEQALETLKAFKLSKSKNTQGVISVFVSRYDRVLDPMLNAGERGLFGILNALDIYDIFKILNTNPNFRILFASTGVKALDSTYIDPAHYVYTLNLSDCVNTLPLDTIKATDFYRLENEPTTTKEEYFSKGTNQISSDRFNRLLLDLEYINIKATESKLLEDGLSAFKLAFKDIFKMMQG
ncbi:transaldolase family protein [Helicobacter sp. 11S02629-2]|uniref:transaldolase family protein n=1 Tax=Helicobacter sp. 11S02629-2 TaxID=1476195 RepID=UPI000BA760C0|nr:transaldolase family protein [Helicobacter sp. 11S02629-2]PAF45663.1 transaldolase [Helicobacter sp. 11S02629-2]